MLELHNCLLLSDPKAFSCKNEDSEIGWPIVTSYKNWERDFIDNLVIDEHLRTDSELP